MARREDRISDGSTLRLVLSVVVLVLGAVVAVGLTPAFTSDTVRVEDDLAHVELGFPVAWLSQDQSGTDPQLPWKAKLTRVQDYPVEVKPTGLAIDLGAALALELVVVGVAALVLRRRG